MANENLSSNDLTTPRGSKTGVVVSDVMDKTVVVETSMLKAHTKYVKRYRVTKRYKAHDPKNEYKIGDRVTIVPCRPISKDKHFRVL